ncbi:MAG TPA: DUF362 domain-containing protein [Gemmatimonadaceae bacterium]|nr:DUF362 domain-containing protein [Gemmatimonadaceae bacterium]
MSHSTRSINRRDFFRGTTAGLAALPLVRFDGLNGMFAPIRSRVALVRTTERKRGVADVLALFDPRGIAGKRVLVKPNFNSADETPASTHADTLAQLVSEMHERGARSVTVGESSGPPQTHAVMKEKGVFDLARDVRFEVVDFELIGDGDWVHFKPAGSRWPDGFYLPRLVVDSEYTVSTCCLKTHGYGGVFTMSLKLSVGFTPKRLRGTMHRSPSMRRMISELNTGYKPQLIVLDGVTAFTDGGPTQGTLKRANVMIAGSDRVAVDAVGLAVLKEIGANQAVMGRRIFEQEQIAEAVELGVGVDGPDAIEIVTRDAESGAYAEKLRAILRLG